MSHLLSLLGPTLWSALAVSVEIGASGRLCRKCVAVGATCFLCDMSLQVSWHEATSLVLVPQQGQAGPLAPSVVAEDRARQRLKAGGLCRMGLEGQPPGTCTPLCAVCT